MKPFTFKQKTALVVSAGLFTLFLSACGADVIETKDTGNSGVTGGKLAVIDGCTIYRFVDGHSDNYKYFVRCDGSRTLNTSWDQSCGKNCTENVAIPTFMKE